MTNEQDIAFQFLLDFLYSLKVIDSSMYEEAWYGYGYKNDPTNR